MHSSKIDIDVDAQRISGTFAFPDTGMPGVLFLHGWAGSQERDLRRAKDIAALGSVCLTFDMRGHAATLSQQRYVTRGDNLNDALAAYDRLAAHPDIDPDAIAVIGSSYGGYLATILTSLRPVRWLALRVPALYRDADWDVPKYALDKADLAEYRSTIVMPADNNALSVSRRFKGDVLIVSSEHDEIVPHAAIASYRAAFINARSLTARIISGADHALSQPEGQRAYDSLLLEWFREMILGARR
ncbi:alpha/beta fold hydrolase [Phyllobacterium sp. 21LDTY02-6]|uniref:alpha/beta hydrolase family protein n=1 Tax=Phyllobacterium sp. 21LDTY02-6 TaxID=2944903 RepID=UPI0020214122|nr:alpha/beta fold hydrolase [Phyllobacterium sp. 21LDTY02-6]MCO4317997.1 alpha/beta fold hydrolase [Phyllobacterium sp. 21LDTY02-6]